MLARQEQEDYDVAQEERQTLRKAAKGPLYKTVETSRTFERRKSSRPPVSVM